MAKPRGTVRLPSVEPGDVGVKDDPDRDQDQLELLDTVLSQLGESDAQGFIRAYRMGQQGNFVDWEYLARFPLAQWNLDSFAQTYRAGLYRFDACDRSGRIIKQVRFLIGGPAGPSAPAGMSPQGHQAPEPPDRRDLLETLLVKSLETQGTILASLIAGLAGGGAGGVKGSDLVAAFKEGRESGSSQTLPHQAAVELIQQGIALAQGGGASSDGDLEGAGLSGMATRALGVLEALLKRHSPGPPPAIVAGSTPAPALAAAAPRVAEASIPPALPTNDPEARVLTVARVFIPKILKEAAAGHDGYTWGCYIAERVPPAYRDHLVMLATAEPAARMAMLTDLEPRLGQFQEFIHAAAEGIREVLIGQDAGEGGDADPEDDDAPEPAGGRAGDNGDGGHDAPAHHPRGTNADRQGVRGEH